MRHLNGILFTLVVLHSVFTPCCIAQSGVSYIESAHVNALPVPHDFDIPIGNIILVFRDGHKKQVTTSGMHGKPLVGPDHATVVWQEFESGRSMTSNRGLTAIVSRFVVWRNGHIVSSLKVERGWCFDWKFFNGSSQLATAQTGSRGPVSFCLYDVKSARLLDIRLETSLPIPVWAVGLKRNYSTWKPHDPVVTQTILCPTHCANRVALSPDGNFIATGERQDDPGMDQRRNYADLRPGGVRLYNLHTGRQMWAHMGKEGGYFTQSLVFSPDSKSVAATTENGTYVWNTSSGASVINFAKDPNNHNDYSNIDWATNNLLAYSDGIAVHVWNSTDWREVAAYPMTDAGHIQFSGEGKLLIISNKNTIGVWNTDTGTLARQVSGLVEPIFAVTKTNILAYASEGNIVHLLSLIDEKETQRSLMTTSKPAVLRYSADGSVLAVSDDQAFRLFDTSTLQVIQSLSKSGFEYEDFHLSLDGSLLACCTPEAWDIILISPTITGGSMITTPKSILPTGRTMNPRNEK